MKTCPHYWVPNAGAGGEPAFRLNSQISAEPTVHAYCPQCFSYGWLTEPQWISIPATGARK